MLRLKVPGPHREHVADDVEIEVPSASSGMVTQNLSEHDAEDAVVTHGLSEHDAHDFVVRPLVEPWGVGSSKDMQSLSEHVADDCVDVEVFSASTGLQNIS